MIDTRFVMKKIPKQCNCKHSSVLELKCRNHYTATTNVPSIKIILYGGFADSIQSFLTSHLPSVIPKWSKGKVQPSFEHLVDLSSVIYIILFSSLGLLKPVPPALMFPINVEGERSRENRGSKREKERRWERALIIYIQKRWHFHTGV